MRRWNAKQKELSLIIGRMSGIESATVQYDEEVKRGLTQQKQKNSDGRRCRLGHRAAVSCAVQIGCRDVTRSRPA